MDHTRTSLLLRVRDTNDQQSWAEFCGVYEPFLRNVARKFGVADRDADDLVSEILMTCLKVLPTFQYDRDKGTFRGWLKTITRNRLNDWWRRQGKEPAKSSLEPGMEPATRDELWEQWDRDYRARILAAAMEEVQSQSEPTTWRCFELHILQQQKAREVAETLKLQPNAVYVNAHRIKERVRKRVADFDEDLT